MQLLAPEALWGFLLLPALIGIYIWMQRRRSKFALRYSSVSLVREAMGKGPGIRRHIPPLLFLLALAAMIFALARPTGMMLLPTEQATVILALDVSGSMRANDMKPSRLEAAKTAARAFAAKQDPNTRIGVVAFSGTAMIVQAPTDDRDAVIAAINRLSTQQSTAIGSGILVSLDAIFEPPKAVAAAARKDDVLTAPTPTPLPVPKGVRGPGTIILLTDGQNRTGPSPLEAAQKASERGIRVFTIGAGTTEGTTLQGGGGGFGFRAILDEDTLKRIAAMTEGAYYHASNEQALVEIYQKLNKELILKSEREESTVVFIGGAFLLLVLSSTISLLWFSRLP